MINIGGVRGSVLTFSSSADLSIKFNEHTTTSTFNDAVDKIPFMGTVTRIDKALRKAQLQMFTKQNGARDGVVKIIILLTDGSQTQRRGSENPAVIADELRNTGIHIVVVGIGNAIDPAELIGLAGDRGYVFSAASFDELITKEFIGKVFSSTCGKFLNINYIIKYRLLISSKIYNFISFFFHFIYFL